MPKISSAVLTAVAAAVALGAASSHPTQAAPAAPVAVTAKAIATPLTAKNQATVITVRNTTKRPLAGLSLVVGPRKGVQVTLAGAKAGTRTRTIAALRAGQTVRVRVQLRRAAAAGPTRGTVNVQVRQRAKTLGRTTLPFGRAAATPVAVTARAIATPLTAKNQATVITVRNTGKRSLAGLSLVVGPRKGVQVTLAGAKAGTRTRTIASLRAGQTVRVRVQLRRAGAAGPTRGAVNVQVRQRGKVLGRTTLSFGPGRTPGTPGTPPPPAPPEQPTLDGRHFWGSQFTLNGTRQYTLLFTGPEYVHIGDLKAAWPSCVVPNEQCKPYTFDPESGALTIDGTPATLEGKKLTFDGQTHWELGRPTAGARWDIVLTHANQSGICPLFCTFFTEHLHFRPDGTFIRSSVTSGTGPVVDWTVIPDDSKGTYEIRADGTLRLAFADGTERIETLGLYPAEDDSYPANPTAGVVLDSDGYFDIRD